MSLRLLLLAIAAGAGLWAFRHWRDAVRLAMVLLVLEGALRKWVLPGAQDLLYFAKDGLLLAAYAGFLTSPKARARTAAVPQLLTVVMAVSAGIGFLQIFNPNLPNLWVGLLGFKSYFLYAPLLWVLPACFQSREELWRFLYRYALLAVPLGLLALAQFASPASSAINSYARGGEGTAFAFGTSSHVRVTSTFSFISGYTSYLFATTILLFGLLSTVQWKLRGYVVLYAALALTLIGMMATGSRGPVVLLIAVLPLYWWLSVMRERGSSLLMRRILGAAGLLALVLGFGATEVVGAFEDRASSVSDMGGRMVSPFLQPFRIAGEAGLFGLGIGATHQAASMLVDGGQPFAWTRGIVIEDETGRVMAELGIMGFVPFYGICVILTLFSFRQATRIRDRFCRSIAVASFLFLLASLPSGIVFNVTSGLYYWFFAGLVSLVVQLDREHVAGTEPATLRATSVTQTTPRGRLPAASPATRPSPRPSPGSAGR